MSEHIWTEEDVRKFGEEMRKVNWSRTEEREAVAQIIVKQVSDEAKKENLMNLITEEVEFMEGDTIEFQTSKTGIAYVHAPGTAAPRMTKLKRTQTLEAELVSADMAFELTQLRAGRYGNVATIKNDAKDALLTRKYKIVWDTLTGSVNSGSANYFTFNDTDNATTKVTQLNAAINYVDDQNGGAVAIIGRKRDMNWLYDFAESSAIAYDDVTKKQLLDMGEIKKYRGLPIVGLRSNKDLFGIDMISSGNIMVLGRDTLKLGVIRGLDALEEIHANIREWEIHMSEMYGCGVFFAERNARIVIT